MSFGSGQNASTNSGSGSNLFGTNSNLFGSASTTGGTSPFGAPPGATTASEAKATFGTSTENKSPFFGFPKSSAPTFSFGQKDSDSEKGNKPSFLNLGQSTSAQSPASSAPATPGQKAPLFGSATTTPAAPAVSESSTPATSGTDFLGQQSTTPAGPPPASGGFGTSNTGLFGTQKPAETAQGTSGPTTAANPFGSGLFSGPNKFSIGGTTSSSTTQPSFSATSDKPKSLFGSNPETSTQPGTSIFGSKPEAAPQASPSIFGATPGTRSQPVPKFFGAATTTTTPQQGSKLFTSTQPTPFSPQSTTPADSGNAKPSLFSFGSGTGQQTNPQTTTSTTAIQPPISSTTTSTQPSSSAPFSGFSIPGVGKDATSDKPTASSTPFSRFNLGGQNEQTTEKQSSTFSGLFNTKGQGTSTTTDQPGSTATAASSQAPLFSVQPTATTAAPATSATSTSATAAPPTSAPSLFGPKVAVTTSETQPAASTTSSNAAAGAGNTLGASTAGPAPTSQSRLKNRTMDEILTRWASDLTKYQKEFQSQAEKVAEWDQMLVDNMAKITKLYVNTATAEKQTNSVEMQLRAVENQQNELESWLDKYEQEVDDMIAKQNVQQGETLQGPDQERERTYKLAEKLANRLDEMGNGLTGMIEEINTASTSLNKTSKSDEPISQIVRILNSHLTQLQAIDQGTVALQAKVNAAQKASQNLGYTMNGSLNGTGAGSGAAEEFYRSYMGRRN